MLISRLKEPQELKAPLDLLIEYVIGMGETFSDLDIVIWKKVGDGSLICEYYNSNNNRVDDKYLADVERMIWLRMDDFDMPISENDIELTEFIVFHFVNDDKLSNKDRDELYDLDLENIVDTFYVSFTKREKVPLPAILFDWFVPLFLSQFRAYNDIYTNNLLFKYQIKHLRHDLRTPLTSVSMISGLLQNEKDDEMKEYGEILFTACEKMDCLLKDFKSKIGQ